MKRLYLIIFFIVIIILIISSEPIAGSACGHGVPACCTQNGYLLCEAHGCYSARDCRISSTCREGLTGYHGMIYGAWLRCGYPPGAKTSENITTDEFSPFLCKTTWSKWYRDPVCNKLTEEEIEETWTNACYDHADNDGGTNFGEDWKEDQPEGCDFGGFCVYPHLGPAHLGTGGWPCPVKYMGADKDCAGDHFIEIAKEIFYNITEKALTEKYGECIRSELQQVCVENCDSTYGVRKYEWQDVCVAKTGWEDEIKEDIAGSRGETIGYYCSDSDDNPIFDTTFPSFGSGITDGNCCLGSEVLENGNFTGNWYCRSGKLLYCGPDDDMYMYYHLIDEPGIFTEEVTIAHLNIEKAEEKLYDGRLYCYKNEKWIEEPDVSEDFCKAAFEEAHPFWEGDIPRIWEDTAPHLHKCCGDDIPEDAGTLTTTGAGLIEGYGKFLCANDTTNIWRWNHVTVKQGDIFNIAKRTSTPKKGILNYWSWGWYGGYSCKSNGDVMCTCGSFSVTCPGDIKVQSGTLWENRGKECWCEPGPTVTVTCSYDVLSDRSKWIACDANDDETPGFNLTLGEKVLAGEIVLAEEHHYICYLNPSNDIEQFGECKGEDPPYNYNWKAYGTNFTTGKTIVANETTYFCTYFSEWTKDLDYGEEPTCIVANQAWTGSQCCGGADDNGEYYNDKEWIEIPADGHVGGCWFGYKVDSNTRVSDLNFIINWDFKDTADLTYGKGFPVGWPDDIYGAAPGRHEIITDHRPGSPDTKALMLINSEEALDINLRSIVIPIDTSKQYIQSAWVKGAYANISVGRQWFDEGGNIIEEDYIPEAEGASFSDWTYVEQVLTPPEEASYLKILLSNRQNIHHAFFDDVQLSFYPTEKVMNYNGNFYGCAINNGLSQYLDRLTNTPLITNQTYCTLKGDFFCSYEKGWETPNMFNGLPRNTTKSTPLDPAIEPSTSCCPAEYCWNGTECVRSEHAIAIPEHPIIVSEDKMYRCIHGNWNLTIKRWTWDNTAFGYCPTTTQCLVDPEGNAGNNNKPEKYDGTHANNPKCIEDIQFIGDHYCDNGTWTSRTKFIVLQLLNLTHEKGDPDNYTLFCDYYKLTLNNYDYGVENRLRGTHLVSTAKLFLTPPVPAKYSCNSTIPFECINNFCILRYIDLVDGQEKIVFGTSLNQPINSESLSFLETLVPHRNYCDNPLPSDSLFKQCKSGDKNIWYSDELNSIIFSKQGIDLEPLSAWEAFVKFLKHPIKGLVSWLADLEIITPEEAKLDYAFAKEIKDYNRLYINHLNGKSIKAVIEEPTKDEKFLAINYTGFDTDICASVRKYADTHPSFPKKGYTYCNHSDTSYYILSDQPTVLDIWPDFTSKLRIS